LSLSAENAAEVLSFWFETAGRQKWFAPDDGFDAAIRTRFETLSIGLAARANLSFETPQIGLAMIIALDQFPRNMYRGTAAPRRRNALTALTVIWMMKTPCFMPAPIKNLLKNLAAFRTVMTSYAAHQPRKS